ncbi:MAG: sigma-70 family RNA polymerase sigma factor [Verrucomicrobiota bacterium]
MTQDPSKAFEILIRQHHRRLLAYAFSITDGNDAAHDLVQDAFLVAWSNLEKFDVTKDFGSWMRGIVRNKVREWARSQKMVGMDEEMLELIEAKHRSWDQQEAESDTDLFSLLEQCLRKLPDLLGKAVELFYLQRMSGAEVAEKMEADEATVRKRLQRARSQLGQCITQQAENHA